MRRSSGALMLLPLALPAALAFSACQRSPQLPQLRGHGRLAGLAAAPRVQLRAENEEPGSVESVESVDISETVEDLQVIKEASHEDGFEIALLGTYGLTIISAAPFVGAVMRAARVPVFKQIAMANAAKMQLSSLQAVQVFVVAALALRVLNSAAARNRLSGTTFKVLAMGLASAFCAIMVNSLYVVGKLLLGPVIKRWTMPFIGGMMSQKMSYVLPLAGVAGLSIFTAFHAVRACYGTLQEHGVPKFKMTIKSKESVVLSLLAMCYFATSLHSVYWGGILAMYSPFKTAGALRCFVVAACAHVLQGAAVAGSKRLSSDTYTTLNLALMFDAGVRLATVMLLRSPKLLWIPSIVALIASVGGFLVGKSYKEKK